MSDDLRGKSVEDLREIVSSLNGKKYLAQYIFSFIQTMGAVRIDEISPLPAKFRGELVEAGYYISKLNILEKQIGSDKTQKYLFELEDGNKIETVLLTDDGRKTVCVSCQVGCRMGCVFCATGYLKFERNLSAGEIAGQVTAISCDIGGKINNIVYMGMGEPLDNYDEVLKAAKILNDEKGLNIGTRKQTISTCGVVPGILRLSEEGFSPRLAVSLHGATDKLRENLVPIAKRYPLNELMAAIKTYQWKTRRRVTFEYCMINGVNDRTKNADNIVRLLKGIKCNVNLIGFNPHPGCDFKASGAEKTAAFRDVLASGGIETVVRMRRGGGVNAACGQLGAEWIGK